MRMKMLKMARAAANWIQTLLEVQVPMGASNGLRARGETEFYGRSGKQWRGYITIKNSNRSGRV